MKNYKGFTLLEMLVIIVVISILTMVGRYSYLVSVEKSRFSEVIPTVISIQNAELAYYVEHRRYVDNIFDLGLDMQGEPEYNLNTSYFSNGKGIRTKYFIYGVEFSKNQKDVGNGVSIFVPCINVYRYRYSTKDNSKEIEYLAGAYLYDLEDPRKKMSTRLKLQGTDRTINNIFKKILEYFDIPAPSVWDFPSA